MRTFLITVAAIVLLGMIPPTVSAASAPAVPLARETVLATLDEGCLSDTTSAVILCRKCMRRLWKIGEEKWIWYCIPVTCNPPHRW